MLASFLALYSVANCTIIMHIKSFASTHNKVTNPCMKVSSLMQIAIWCCNLYALLQRYSLTDVLISFIRMYNTVAKITWRSKISITA